MLLKTRDRELESFILSTTSVFIDELETLSSSCIIKQGRVFKEKDISSVLLGLLKIANPK